MKTILIIHSNMELGGAETSLLGLLQSIDYTKYSVDLMLLEQKGALLPLIPDTVRLIKAPKEYQCLVLPIKEVLLKKHALGITLARVLGKIVGQKRNDKTYAIKQAAHRFALPFIPELPGSYDMAISFIDPHYVVAKRINAKITLGWMHTDFSRIHLDKKYDFQMWNDLDYSVHISDSCKEKFDRVYPELSQKSIVIENVLSKAFIEQRSNDEEVKNEMPEDGTIRILTVGRFSHQKRMDEIPKICSLLVEQGENIKWYLVGYGGDEQLIRQKILEAKMEKHVIILGKKDNPYPYIKACDIYIQPSRYEGKCVAVREAQMLGKPVIITNYATASSQLEDGVDGVVVPMDIQGCADGIARVLRDSKIRECLSNVCKQRDYTNSKEIEKLYKMFY